MRPAQAGSSRRYAPRSALVASAVCSPRAMAHWMWRITSCQTMPRWRRDGEHAEGRDQTSVPRWTRDGEACSARVDQGW
jgi:hypothetical protein